MLKSVRCFSLLAALFLLVGFAAPNHGALAQFTVTNTMDSGAGSLRDAVAAANASGGTIDFDIDNGLDPNCGGGICTITLTSAASSAVGPSALLVSEAITIDGDSDPDGDAIVIDADGDKRHFIVAATGDLTLEFLTLQNGMAEGFEGGESRRGGAGGGGAGIGGAIYVEGATLTVLNSTLTGNTAQGGDGGDIEAPNGNPRGGAGGAGLSGDGSDATPIDTPGSGGSGGGGDGGAGDCSSGDPGTSLGGAGGGGGGTANDPACDGGDGAVGGGGGGGGGGSTGQPSGSGGSGGLGGGDGANGDSGGGINEPGGGGGGGGGLGGAVFNRNGTVTIRNSTISGNTATGGTGGGGNGGNTGDNGEGLGGGIFNYNGTLTTQNVTINDNVADDGGGIYNLGDAATATAIIDNTILANSNDSGNALKNGSFAPVDDYVSGTVNGGTETDSGTGNLIESHTGFSGVIDTTADPQLDPLADNGGLTETHNLAGTSPAIDEGDDTKVPGGQTADQRGGSFPRQTGTVDIGAIESTPRPDLEVTKVDSVDPVTAGSGTSNLTHTVTVENIGTIDVTGAVLSETITLPSGVTIESIDVTQGTYLPANDPNGTWTLGDVDAGDSETLTITYTVGPSAPDGAMITNTAAVTSTTQPDPDPVSANDMATEETTIEREADLDVTKTESIDPVIAGSGASNLTHVVTVENDGPSDASGVVVTEAITLPADATIVSITASDGTYLPANDPNGTWTIGDLAAGDSETLTIVYTVGPSAPDGSTVENTATATLNESDPDAGNNTFTIDTNVVAEADLSITKTDDIDPIEPGQTLTYTVTVDNAGPSDAQDVVVTETLPASGVTFDSTTGCMEDPAGDPTCTLGTIPAGGSAMFTVTVTIDAPAPAGLEMITNAVSVASTTTDPDGSNNDADEDTVIDAEPDLALTKDDGVLKAFPGDVITYTLDYLNNGDQDAADVAIEETVPDNTVFNAGASTSGWSCTDGDPPGTTCTFDVDAEIGTVAGLGGGGSVLFAVTVDNPVMANADKAENVADIIDGTGEDPNLADNTATETTPIIASPVIVVAKMEASIIEFVGGPGADPGDRIKYTVTITNTGDENAADVTFDDTVDPNTSLDCGSISAVPMASLSSCSPGPGGSLTIDVGALMGGGGLITIMFEVAVNDPFPDDVFEVANQGTVSGDNFANVLTDDPAVAGSKDPTVTPINRADVAITKTLKDVTEDEGAPGVEDDKIVVTFTLKVTNLGPDPATDVVVNDPVPDGAAYVSDSGGYDPISGDWNVGDLGVGSSAMLVLVLEAPSTHNLVNIATVRAAQPDPAKGNNLAGAQAQHDLDLRRFSADLSLTKTVDDTTPTVGDLVVYTLTITNDGPSTTSGVVARDRLPAGLEFVSAETTSTAGPCSTCGYVDTLGVWIVGQIPVGASATLKITAQVTEAGEITNTAEIIEGHLPDLDSVFGDGDPSDDDQDSATLTASNAQAKSTATESETGVPTAFAVYQNYPNPFNPETTIPFAAPTQGHVRIAVYDLLGREVAVLIDDVVSAGRHEVRWQADNIPTGLYLVRLQSGSTVKTQRATLLK